MRATKYGALLHFPLVPAKAGTQGFHSPAPKLWLWIPARAGMSGVC